MFFMPGKALVSGKARLVTEGDGTIRMFFTDNLEVLKLTAVMEATCSSAD